MNPLIVGLGIALAISGASNLWLFNSRDGALKKLAETSSELNNSREVAGICSRSVASLDAKAVEAAKVSEAAIADARAASKGKQGSGQATLQKPRSVPTDECKSVDALLDEWYKSRGAK